MDTINNGQIICLGGVSSHRGAAMSTFGEAELCSETKISFNSKAVFLFEKRHYHCMMYVDGFDNGVNWTGSVLKQSPFVNETLCSQSHDCFWYRLRGIVGDVINYACQELGRRF